ncbi:hypothetical protein CC79DRAFT_1367534 [Sarocladium strictum]
MDFSANNHVLDLASHSEGNHPSSHMSQYRPSTVANQPNSDARNEQNIGIVNNSIMAGGDSNLEMLSSVSAGFAPDTLVSAHSLPDSPGSKEASSAPSPVFSDDYATSESSASSVSDSEDSDSGSSTSEETEFTDLDSASDEDDSGHANPTSSEQQTRYTMILIILWVYFNDDSGG